jgi:hypothetical protein
MLSLHGAKALLWFAVACIGLAVILPGQMFGERAGVLWNGLIGTLGSYWFFRLVLRGVAWLGDLFLGRVAYWYISFVLWAAVLAAPLAVVMLPFQWQQLHAGDVTGPLYLSCLPAILSAALAAARIIKDCYLEG